MRDLQNKERRERGRGEGSTNRRFFQPGHNKPAMRCERLLCEVSG